jgi:hypothetical protein
MVARESVDDCNFQKNKNGTLCEKRAKNRLPLLFDSQLRGEISPDPGGFR